jgi:hypothetical protein
VGSEEVGSVTLFPREEGTPGQCSRARGGGISTVWPASSWGRRKLGEDHAVVRERVEAG